MLTQLNIACPDDFHAHLREGAAMASVVEHTAQRFARAIAMPNLNLPVITTEGALAYRERILEALPPGLEFEPLMTLYLTETTPVAEIQKAKASGRVYAVKYYPAGATTHSRDGVRDIRRTFRVLGALEELGMPLLVHGEVTDPAVDVFDREEAFIERILAPLVDRFSALKIVFEHITTRAAVRFVSEGPARLAATITAHHLLLNRNALFDGGLRPHQYCLPVMKREADRLALVAAAASGSPKFFLGTDSAPHRIEAKESACASAGIYTAHAAIELYAEAFEQAGALARLEGFASLYGADFYGLPRNSSRILLRQEPWVIPEALNFGDSRLRPFRGGQACRWRLVRS